MSMSVSQLPSSKLLHNFIKKRTFIAARVKWVRDPYLDNLVQSEKDLKPLISLKNTILSSPCNTLSLSSASLLKPQLDLPTSLSRFSQNYPSFFTVFQPYPSLPLHIKLTPKALSLHKEEAQVYNSPTHKEDTARRLAKLMMLTGKGRLPLGLVDLFKFDLGLPHNYVTEFFCDFPDFFNVGVLKDEVTGEDELGLELVRWRDELGMSVLEERRRNSESIEGRKGMHIRFSMNFPKGFELEKKVRNWVDEWQDLPYISPYEDAFHLVPSSDQAEKWMVGIIHELLWLLVSKRTERSNVLRLGEYLGFGMRFKKVIAHHPGIFYVSNKNRTQTVVLREAHKKGFLTEKHPLMGMRHRYIYLMNQRVRRRRDEVRPRMVIGKHGSILKRNRQKEEDLNIE